MKIILICSSLEPGRDGVGDYTRRLGGELIRLGHDVIAISYYDKHICHKLEERQKVDDQILNVLRVPSKFSSKIRYNYVNKLVIDYKPEWISVQFVPFAYDSHGLPFSFILNIRKITKGIHVQLMFHESWVNDGGNLNFKRWAYSTLQKFLIRYLLFKIRPKLIHTHLPFYHRQIENLGYNVKPLPLFSNVPNVTSYLVIKESNILRVCFFSQIDAGVNIIKILISLKECAIKDGKKFEILVIGGNKGSIETFIKRLKKEGEIWKNVHITGHLNLKDLSFALNSCTLGISPVPRHGLGKSGSVAAFIQHGIPVSAPNIHPGCDPFDIGFFTPNLKSAILIEPNLNNYYKAKKFALKAQKEIGISTITEKFLSDIHLYGMEQSRYSHNN